MQKREVTKKQLAVIILLSIGMLAAAALLNQFFPAGSKQTKETLKQTAVTPKVTALPSLSPTQNRHRRLTRPKSSNFLSGTKGL